MASKQYKVMTKKTLIDYFDFWGPLSLTIFNNVCLAVSIQRWEEVMDKHPNLQHT